MNKSTKFGGRNNLGVTGSGQGCHDHATGPLPQSASAERLPHEQTRRLIVPGFGDDPGMPDEWSIRVTWMPERPAPLQAQCRQDPRLSTTESKLEFGRDDWGLAPSTPELHGVIGEPAHEDHLYDWSSRTNL